MSQTEHSQQQVGTVKQGQKSSKGKPKDPQISLGEQFRESQEEQAMSALSCGSAGGVELEELINQIQSNELMRNQLDRDTNFIGSAPASALNIGTGDRAQTTKDGKKGDKPTRPREESQEAQKNIKADRFKNKAFQKINEKRAQIAQDILKKAQKIQRTKKVNRNSKSKQAEKSNAQARNAFQQLTVGSAYGSKEESDLQSELKQQDDEILNLQYPQQSNMKVSSRDLIIPQDDINSQRRISNPQVESAPQNINSNTHSTDLLLQMVQLPPNTENQFDDIDKAEGNQANEGEKGYGQSQKIQLNTLVLPKNTSLYSNEQAKHDYNTNMKKQTISSNSNSTKSKSPINKLKYIPIAQIAQQANSRTQQILTKGILNAAYNHAAAQQSQIAPTPQIVKADHQKDLIRNQDEIPQLQSNRFAQDNQQENTQKRNEYFQMKPSYDTAEDEAPRKISNIILNSFDKREVPTYTSTGVKASNDDRQEQQHQRRTKISNDTGPQIEITPYRQSIFEEQQKDIHDNNQELNYNKWDKNMQVS